MNLDKLKHQVDQTPAFVFDLDRVKQNLGPLQQIKKSTGCQVLYSMKALPIGALLSALKGQVDGISVSSLFEAQLANEIFGAVGSLHLTTPGLRNDEFAEISGLCNHISFNSLSQYDRLHDRSVGYSKGLRVNPKLSFAEDERYDPCRLHSKLGVGIEQLSDGLPAEIEGLHVHTVFGRTDFLPLPGIVAKLQPLLQSRPFKWLNLGGGYLYPEIANLEPLIGIIRRLKSEFVEHVYLEPGKALVGNAGFLITTVLDSFDSDGKTVLVLDTSINHHPKVFEYQFKPRLLEESSQATHSAILAGSTCLAGDLFGEYRFDRMPEVGEKLVFADVGAYSLIKANRFNGYALPAVYIHENGQLKLRSIDHYADFRQRWFI
ncbi:MAG: carboxynorspermidine decarboxylase [Gammaproteobacteria bacterium]